METKIFLDSDISIDILNKKPQAKELLNKITKNNIFLTTINIYELMKRKINIEEIEFYINKFDKIDFTEKTAIIVSRIEKELNKQRKRIDIRDLFIASICISNNCALATFNKKHFENIKGLKII